MSQNNLEKIKELQDIFDSLESDQELQYIIDGVYDSTITNFEIKESKKGNKYIQINFDVPGFFPVIKRVMITNYQGLISKNITHICNFSKKFGMLTTDYNSAVKYLNSLKLAAKISVFNTDKDFYDVIIDLKEVKEINASI